VNTLPTLQGAQIRTLSKRAHWAPGLALALAALLALLLTAGMGLIDAVQAQGPAIRYVDADAPGPTHDGLSWTMAYTTVQPDTAQPCLQRQLGARLRRRDVPFQL